MLTLLLNVLFLTMVDGKLHGSMVAKDGLLDQYLLFPSRLIWFRLHEVGITWIELTDNGTRSSALTRAVCNRRHRTQWVTRSGRNELNPTRLLEKVRKWRNVRSRAGSLTTSIQKYIIMKFPLQFADMENMIVIFD